MARPRSSRPGPGGTATLEHVAAAAGVSVATASRVVNGNPNVTPVTRAAVEEAIARLGYVPNRAARSLMTRRSDSIGVVILESANRLFGDPFFGQLLLGISGGLTERDLQLVLLMAPTPAEEARVARYLGAGHVDGAILVGPHGDDPLPGRLAKAGIPVVVTGRLSSDAELSYVDVDNRAGAQAAVAHLLAQGRRRIATIHGTLDLVSGRDRLDGYRDALAAAGVAEDPTLIASGDFSLEEAAEAMRNLLERHPDLDAVFAASDSMASGAIRTLREAGRMIPDDVAIVGFDDAPIARATRPALSTVRQPIEAMGREMTRLLLHRLDRPDDPPSHVVFPTELVVRESSLPKVAGAGRR